MSVCEQGFLPPRLDPPFFSLWAWRTPGWAVPQWFAGAPEQSNYEGLLRGECSQVRCPSKAARVLSPTLCLHNSAAVLTWGMQEDDAFPGPWLLQLLRHLPGRGCTRGQPQASTSWAGHDGPSCSGAAGPFCFSAHVHF